MFSTLPNAGNAPRRGIVRAGWAALGVVAFIATGSAAQELPNAPLTVGMPLMVVADSPQSELADPTLFRHLFKEPDERTSLPEHALWHEWREDAVLVDAGVPALTPRWEEQDPQTPPTPASTGIRAVFRETWRDFKMR